MKTYRFIFFIFFTPVIVSGQNYIPLPEQNATWNLDFYSIFCAGPPPGYCFSQSFSIISDTLIGSHTYHLTNFPSFAVTNFIPAYRQDNTNKKVYFPWESSPGNYVDTILFDYDLNIGDSIVQLINGPGVNEYFPVVNIDSVFNGSVYIKRWILGNPPSGYMSYWVYEGVGNYLGLFGPFASFESGFTINCMTKESNTFFPNDSSSCTYVSVNEYSKNNTVSIAPTIAHANQQLSIHNKSNQRIKKFRIIDSTGRSVFNQSNIEDSIILPYLLSNFYIVRIELFNNEVVICKIIII